MRILIAPAYYAELQRQVRPAYGHDSSLAAPRIEVSPHLPAQSICSDCAGNGEGAESTYCPACHGAGGTKTIGLVLDVAPPMRLITAPLPKKFTPYFPRDLVAPAPLCRGLP